MKEKAIELRKLGHSLTEICKLLSKADSTVYRWIKDIPDTDNIKFRRHKNLVPGLTTKRKAEFQRKRIEYDKLGQELFDSNVNFRNLCLLYWCEGSKDKDKNAFSICNTDPVMIKFVVDVLKEIGCLGKQYLYIVCHPNSANDEEIIRFWSDIAETKNIRIKRKDNTDSTRKNRHLYGICSFTLSSTKLACMVLGCIERIKNQQIRLYQNNSKPNRLSGNAAL